MIDLILGVILMLICVAGIGWFLSGIAIKPVIESYQSLKQFTADASHELRNPIAMIQTNIQMALAYPDRESNLSKKQLQVIERLTKRLGNLVNDLLFLARADSGMLTTNFQSVPLDALLIEVMEEQKILAEKKGISLALNFQGENEENNQDLEEVFTLKGDWDQLARLFTNLISNSLEHTNNNDRVIVELTCIKKSSKINSNSYRDKYPFLQVKIQDTGEGIPESSIPHIFDRFYRLDPARSNYKKNSNSTGLGLAIARAIVENHQGNITVESVINQGTTIKVMLPKINEI
jgi:OmpR-family two-component system manganese-sensing sensor histidine kinase